MTGLDVDCLLTDPIKQFELWFAEASNIAGLDYANACCLSTLDEAGFPDGRMVLLKDITPEGFVFYTNSLSSKGRALKRTPRAAMTFYWDALDRQVRIQGEVQIVDAKIADQYFATRPREAQLGAWASKQSEELTSRAELEKRIQEFDQKFSAGAVMRPPHWNGYCLRPLRIEFWQEQAHRRHDRFLYSRGESSGNWSLKRLYP